MHKQQFLSALEDGLSCLPEEDIKRSVEYYSEMIDDRMDDGLSEAEAISGLGAADALAGKVLLETPLPKLVRARVRPNRALRAWEILLLILGAPMWLPLLLLAACVVLTIYIVFWSVIVCLYAAVLSIAACGIAGVAGVVMFLMRGSVAQALFVLGAGMACMGLAIFAFFGVHAVTKGLLRLSGMLLRRIKACFIRKEGAE